jgi:cytochrome c553
MFTNTRLGFALLAMLGLSACAEVNLDTAPGAAAGCEDPTEDNLNPQAPMLPGRSCMACHRQGGQASGAVWTASGTVYGSSSSACNSGGLEGVKVELADENRKILITLYTNRSGNFYTAEPLQYEKLIARVSKDGKIKEMSTPVPSGDCAGCHNPTGPAGGRIYLN